MKHHCKTPLKKDYRNFRAGLRWRCPDKNCRKEWFLRPAVPGLPLLIWKDA